MRKRKRANSIRENFLRNRGGKLISVESYILAFIVFFFLNLTKEQSMEVSLFFAFIVGFIFPVIIGIFKTLAWIAAAVFSLLWGALAFAIVGEIVKGSTLIAILAGIIFFAISFIVHKNYSGLLFREIASKSMDTQTEIIKSEEKSSKLLFCPKCGRCIRSADIGCDICNR